MVYYAALTAHGRAWATAMPEAMRPATTGTGAISTNRTATAVVHFIATSRFMQSALPGHDARDAVGWSRRLGILDRR
jgi:hypothetical protein